MSAPKFEIPPVWKMSKKAQELWWQKVAAERGCTLSDWDNPNSEWRKRINARGQVRGEMQ